VRDAQSIAVPAGQGRILNPLEAFLVLDEEAEAVGDPTQEQERDVKPHDSVEDTAVPLPGG
jgi:hypothetical protein